MSQKLTLAALAMFVSGTAFAADNLYTTLDANKDGGISQEEASVMPGLNGKWVELDANADGMLDKAEFAKLEAAGADAQ
jgi:hypothetical protein